MPAAKKDLTAEELRERGMKALMAVIRDAVIASSTARVEWLVSDSLGREEDAPFVGPTWMSFENLFAPPPPRVVGAAKKPAVKKPVTPVTIPQGSQRVIAEIIMGAARFIETAVRPAAGGDILARLTPAAGGPPAAPLVLMRATAASSVRALSVHPLSRNFEFPTRLRAAAGDLVDDKPKLDVDNGAFEYTCLAFLKTIGVHAATRAFAAKRRISINESVLCSIIGSFAIGFDAASEAATFDVLESARANFNKFAFNVMLERSKKSASVNAAAAALAARVAALAAAKAAGTADAAAGAAADDATAADAAAADDATAADDAAEADDAEEEEDAAEEEDDAAAEEDAT